MKKIKDFIWKTIFSLGYIKVFFNNLFKKKYKILFVVSRKRKRENQRFIEDTVAKSFASKYRI
jgi:hypothetical protein